MMAADELEAIETTVADRFGWDWKLIEITPIKTLIRWYERAVKLYEHESKINGK